MRCVMQGDLTPHFVFMSARSGVEASDGLRDIENAGEGIAITTD